MYIIFSPQRRDDTLEMSKQGETLIINGDLVDFSVIPDGASLPAGAVSNEFVTGTVKRIDGELHVTVILPHGPNPSQSVAFPHPISVMADRPIQLPGVNDGDN